MGEGLKRAAGAIYDTGTGFDFSAGLASGKADAVSPLGARTVPVVRLNGTDDETDWVAEEVPVALVYNDISHAVMMTTPTMLEEFALGFSLAEGIVPDSSHIYEMDVNEACRGMEVRMRISSECFWHLKEHRRSMTGRTGCGICGTESLEGAIRQKRRVPDTQHFHMQNHAAAMSYLDEVEQLGRLTGCTHAAVWVNPDGSFAGGAEDVGRHVALDKLLGLRALRGWKDGALVISSRASYEMVQKAAMCGVEILFAVSAPTALAVEFAQDCGVTLAAFCRRGRANVYSRPDRLIGL